MKSSEKMEIRKQDFGKITKWLWSQNKLSGFEKNIFFKLLYNCIPDKEVLWNRGLKSNPICSFCDSAFENL